jgi:hypothetical protein
MAFGDNKPTQLTEFEELDVTEIEKLGPSERQAYLRREAARGAQKSQRSLESGAEAQAALAKSLPAMLKRQLATGMMGMAGPGAAGLAALGQMSKFAPDITRAGQEGEARAAQAAADAAVAGVEKSTYLQEQGVGTKAATQADVKQRIENIKKDLRNPLFGIDSDDLKREIESLKAYYTDDQGNLDPAVAAYIDEQAAVEEKEASGWDIF